MSAGYAITDDRASRSGKSDEMAKRFIAEKAGALFTATDTLEEQKRLYQYDPEKVKKIDEKINGLWIAVKANEIRDYVTYNAGKEVLLYAVAEIVTDGLATPLILRRLANAEKDLHKGTIVENNFYRDGSIVDIGEHFGKFEDGASFLMPESYVSKYSQFDRDDGLFVSPSSYIDDILKQTNGDNYLIKQKLGIDSDTWNQSLIRIDIQKPFDYNPRLPSPINSGSNHNFIPGGYTSGWIPEIVIDPVKPINVIKRPVKKGVN